MRTSVYIVCYIKKHLMILSFLQSSDYNVTGVQLWKLNIVPRTDLVRVELLLHLLHVAGDGRLALQPVLGRQQPRQHLRGHRVTFFKASLLFHRPESDDFSFWFIMRVLITVFIELFCSSPPCKDSFLIFFFKWKSLQFAFFFIYLINTHKAKIVINFLIHFLCNIYFISLFSLNE